METLGLGQMRELLPVIDSGTQVRSRRAALARLVTEAADAGDSVALGLLKEGADGLAECVEAVSRTLDFGNGALEVALTGGLGEHVPAYRELVHRAVERRVPAARCVAPRASNVVGAALVALRSLPQTPRSGGSRCSCWGQIDSIEALVRSGCALQPPRWLVPAILSGLRPALFRSRDSPSVRGASRARQAL